MNALRMVQAGMTLTLCYAATAIMALGVLTVVGAAAVAVGVSRLARAQ